MHARRAGKVSEKIIYTILIGCHYLGYSGPYPGSRVQSTNGPQTTRVLSSPATPWAQAISSRSAIVPHDSNLLATTMPVPRVLAAVG